MRLLLINPNTTSAITEKVAAEARRMARPDTEIIAVTGAFGARYISSRAAYAVAAHAALDAYAHGPAHDAVVLACFGDPGWMPCAKSRRSRWSAWPMPRSGPLVPRGSASPSSPVACGGWRCWRSSSPREG